MKTLFKNFRSQLIRLGWPHLLSARRARKAYRSARYAQNNGHKEQAAQEYRLALEMDPLAHSVEWGILRNGTAAFRKRQKISRWVRSRLPDIVADAQKWPRNETVPHTYMYWDTGFSSAPPLVQKCFESLKSNCSAPVVELTMTNVQDISGIPTDLFDKLSNRQVFLTDVVRMYLLASRGGIWADATVYFSDTCPSLQELTQEQGFFAFRDIGLEGRISSWFVAAEAHSYVARIMAVALTRFWREYDTPPLYHFLHAIFETMYLLDSRFAAEFDRALELDRMPPHQMQFNMFEKYDPAEFSRFLKNSSIHKMTFKFDSERSTENSVLSHFLTTA